MQYSALLLAVLPVAFAHNGEYHGAGYGAAVTMTSTHVVTVPCGTCPGTTVAPEEPSFTILPVVSPSLSPEDTVPAAEPTEVTETPAAEPEPTSSAGEPTEPETTPFAEPEPTTLVPSVVPPYPAGNSTAPAASGTAPVASGSSVPSSSGSDDSGDEPEETADSSASASATAVPDSAAASLRVPAVMAALLFAGGLLV